MKNYIIPVERIKKAQIRYYDGNGTLIPDIQAYTIFIKNDNAYINLFNYVMECNVYERMPYSNSTIDGESYGSKIKLASGKEERGICYVLEYESMKELRNLDSISIMDLYKVILESKDLYYDRRDIIHAYPHLLKYRERKRILERDNQMIDKLNDFFDEMEIGKSYKKINN